MAQLQNFFPTSNDPFLKKESDMALAKFGHLNALVSAYNTLDAFVNGISGASGAVKANTIQELTAGAGISLLQPLIQDRTSNVTKTGAATLTAAEVSTGLIIYTGGAQTLILPTATALATQLGATKGTTFDIVLDNTGGSGTVTLAINTGFSSVSALTGGTTMTLANSATAMAGFRITFYTTSNAIISRLY